MSSVDHYRYTSIFYTQVYQLVFYIHFLHKLLKGNFHCDTIQPGCKQLCFNRFSPMQHPRFWGFQMLFCTLPSVIFILITSNEEAQISKIDSLQDQFAADNMEDTEKCYENSKQYQKLEKKKKQIGTIKRKQVNLKPVNGAYQST